MKIKLTSCPNGAHRIVNNTLATSGGLLTPKCNRPLLHARQTFSYIASGGVRSISFQALPAGPGIVVSGRNVNAAFSNVSGNGSAANVASAGGPPVGTLSSASLRRVVNLLVVDAAGKVTEETRTITQLKEESRLHMRELLIVEQPSSLIQPRILPRRHCIVLTLGPVRAIIFTDRVYLFSSALLPGAKDFAVTLSNQLQQLGLARGGRVDASGVLVGVGSPTGHPGHVTDGQVSHPSIIIPGTGLTNGKPAASVNPNHEKDEATPFELLVIEQALLLTTMKQAKRVAYARKLLDRLLSKMGTVEKDDGNLYALFPLANTISHYELMTRGICECVRALLDDDRDMREACLSDKSKIARDMAEEAAAEAAAAAEADKAEYEMQVMEDGSSSGGGASAHGASHGHAGHQGPQHRFGPRREDDMESTLLVDPTGRVVHAHDASADPRLGGPSGYGSLGSPLTPGLGAAQRPPARPRARADEEEGALPRRMQSPGRATGLSALPYQYGAVVEDEGEYGQPGGAIAGWPPGSKAGRSDKGGSSYTVPGTGRHHHHPGSPLAYPGPSHGYGHASYGSYQPHYHGPQAPEDSRILRVSQDALSSLELMLESIYHRAAELNMEAVELGRTIRNKQDLLELQQSNYRNFILSVTLRMSVLSVSIAGATFVTSAFGQNLLSGVEGLPGGLWAVTGGSCMLGWYMYRTFEKATVSSSPTAAYARRLQTFSDFLFKLDSKVDAAKTTLAVAAGTGTAAAGSAALAALQAQQAALPGGQAFAQTGAGTAGNGLSQALGYASPPFAVGTTAMSSRVHPQEFPRISPFKSARDGSAGGALAAAGGASVEGEAGHAASGVSSGYASDGDQEQASGDGQLDDGGLGMGMGPTSIGGMRGLGPLDNALARRSSMMARMRPLSREDFKQLHARTTGRTLSDDEVDLLFDIFDADADGLLRIEEVVDVGTLSFNETSTGKARSR